MPMTDFHYHGQAVGMNGQITTPGSHVIDNHAKCGIADGSAEHGPFEISGILSYSRCYTTVKAMPEDAQGFFRTEVRGTVENLKMLGEVSLSVDRITMGLVSVYRRQWYDRPSPHAQRARVLPFDCRFEGLVMKGSPTLPLPPPFTYAPAQREAYLTGDDPDPAMDAEVRAAIAASPAGSIYIPNFGRIFYGEWTIIPGDIWHPVHQITMVRAAMGSPVVGEITVHRLEGDGRPTPP